MAYREDQKIQIQEATDLVALVGEQIALRPKGREHVGLCPFHDDRNPSMYVNPQKQIYKCFVCGAGGDAYSFVMNYHKMTFPEAMKYLADRAGIELVRESGIGGQEASDDRKIIADANEKARKFFSAMLNDTEVGAVAQRYIEQRGISTEMVEHFGSLGWARQCPGPKGPEPQRFHRSRPHRGTKSGRRLLRQVTPSSDLSHQRQPRSTDCLRRPQAA